MSLGRISNGKEKILSNRYDVRKYFHHIYRIVIASYFKESLPEFVSISDQIYQKETLEACFQAFYPNKKFVIIFYAHQPLDKKYKTNYHTSLLLCGVKDNRIDSHAVINVDSYHYLSYIDLLGECGDINQAQIKIKQRVVVCINKLTSHTPDPLQIPSWENMNCAIYSANIAKSLIVMMQDPVKMQVLYRSLEKCRESTNNITRLISVSSRNMDDDETAKMIYLIGEVLLDQNVYLEKDERGDIIRNQINTNKYHNAIREEIFITAQIKEENIEIPLEKAAIGIAVGFFLFLLIIIIFKEQFLINTWLGVSLAGLCMISGGFVGALLKCANTEHEKNSITSTNNITKRLGINPQELKQNTALNEPNSKNSLDNVIIEEKVASVIPQETSLLLKHKYGL